MNNTLAHNGFVDMIQGSITDHCPGAFRHAVLVSDQQSDICQWEGESRTSTPMTNDGNTLDSQQRGQVAQRRFDSYIIPNQCLVKWPDLGLK